ncbi:hypothetical protein OX284_009045 [Flavobacterium sp. SUN046]|uniref:hypothetical protein n=1 Tax=Flavobacterium sp. SUN046 TaxID=3002440 RepID=UPI002DBC3D7D|nr:hypothetical protein [Flavobacterium sp. SUN046]MEC4049572.1 hypothetical protein [Flavobacterium sp. SUN046]
MKDILRFLKYFSIFFSISILFEIWMIYIESEYLKSFLKSNILTILLAFLAINTATLGVIASKIQEIKTKFKDCDFSNTINEMYFSLKEQVVLLIMNIFVLVIDDSKLICFSYKCLIVNSLLSSIFFYSIYVLWDTGKAVFVMTTLSNEVNDNTTT